MDLKILRVKDYRKWVVRLYIDILLEDTLQQVYYDVLEDKWDYNGCKNIDVDFLLLENQLTKLLYKFLTTSDVLTYLEHYKKIENMSIEEVKLSDLANIRDCYIYLENERYRTPYKFID